MITKGHVYAGSKDESLRIYDHQKKRSEGTLTGHNGTIFKISYTSQYLISGDDNGNIIIWGNKNKALYHILNCSKHGLLDYDLHTSEKLLASICPEGKFYKLQLWS